MDISPYVYGHKSIIETEEKRKLAFYQKATAKAKQIANTLDQEFTGIELWLFGSLVTDLFEIDSDIDLAVKGLKEEDFFKAYRIAEDIADPIPIDFVQVEHCIESLRERIEQEGVRL